MTEQIRRRSLRQSSTSQREIPTAGMMRGSAPATVFPNSLTAQRTRSAVAAPNYYRTAEFLLAPHDPRRTISWKKNIETFYRGLDTLGVRCDRISAPYGAHHLN